MTDTHTHLYSLNGNGEPAAAVERALLAGVRRMILPGVDLQSVEPMRRLAALFPDSLQMAMGLHPTDLGEDWRTHLRRIGERMLGSDIVAIGEVGMDYHWDSSNKEEQREAFETQIMLAAEAGLPVIIHSRDALEDTLKAIEEVKTGLSHQRSDKGAGEPTVLPKLIFHSFTGSPADVWRIREICDPYFGINGVVTFKNAGALGDAVKEIGIERILLETDSPYLAPVPHRGRRNESSYLPAIRDKVAELLAITPADCEEQTDRNADAVFSVRKEVTPSLISEIMS